MPTSCLFTCQMPIDFELQTFWAVEKIVPSRDTFFTKEELACEAHFAETIIRTSTRRFVVKLSLKPTSTQPGATEKVAISRLLSMELKFLKDSNMKTEYIAFMSEYESLRHMTEILSELKSKIPVYYMLHHSVQNPDSTTTKTLVVSDASCKSSTSLSLNDVLMIGPIIQDDLVLILLRFCKHNVIGDLAKMYRQRILQSIIWRETPEKQIKYYQLNTVTYGMASSSFLATRCLYQIALKNAEQFRIECQ
ncbi:hypothetical protein ILUMI_14362, partial [Ignelater luminosus]